MTAQRAMEDLFLNIYTDYILSGKIIYWNRTSLNIRDEVFKMRVNNAIRFYIAV